LRAGRGRPLGFLVLALLIVGLANGDRRPLSLVRLGGFDTYQILWPRMRVSAPVVIVEIDDGSLRIHGQWPWPRTFLAGLVSRITAGRPAAIGMDILMPEADRLSPGALPALVPDLDRDLAERLARLPSNEQALARVFRGQPIVLAVAGLETPPAPGAPTGRLAPVRIVGSNPAPFVRHFASLLRSLSVVDDAAAGHGLISVDLHGGLVRRMPLIAAVGEQLVPGLGPELLRVASDTPALTVRSGGAGVESVGIGDLRIPTQHDGSVWIHFSRSDASRFVSAARVMSGAVDPATFEKKLVLIGVTAVGLSDYRGTSVAERMAGVEIHAQLLECIFDRDLLFRPAWSALAEGGWLAVSGIFLVLLVPQLGVRKSTTLLLALIGPTIGLGVLLYLCCQILFDAALPTVGLALLFTTMLGVTLAESDSQRRALRAEVERQREVALRLAGELEAARRIQMGILPDPAVTFADERRLQFYAFLDPAREVGGDLYDFFPLDDERVFVLIGDVSGKGLPGSLFMAVSKTLCKSSALRHAGDVGVMMREANAEIARDNGEGLFVTAWAGVVNARTGELQYVNAGHEPPYLVAAEGDLPAKKLADGGGPPFCVVDGFPYEAVSYRLQPGEVLCLITDGVTEALNAADEFYGRRRLEDLLNGLAPGADPDTVGEAIRVDVDRFTAGVEPSDDVAILAFRWNGVSAR